MEAAAILNLLLSPILVTLSISSSDWLHFCKITLVYLNRPLSYYFMCKNPKWRPPQSWIIFLFNIIVYPSSKLPANVFKIRVLMLDVCWIV